MKIDTYTKVVLTGILILLGAIAFDYKPTIQAQASSSGGVEMVVTGGDLRVFHLKDGKIRVCDIRNCHPWMD